MAYYGDAYYGDTSYASSSVDAPVELDFYRTDTDGVYVFHWTFRPEFISPALATFDYELQLDLVDTFDSPDLMTFTSANVLQFQNGNANKGFSVNVYPRVESETIPFFARVRVKFGLNYGDYSETLNVETFERVVQETADRLLTALPDGHVYPKDEVNLPLDQRLTNISKVYEGVGEEFDRLFQEKEQTVDDAFIRRVRDERIYVIHGAKFGFPKPTTMQFVDYRHCLMHAKEAVFMGSTVAAIKLVAGCFTGVNPDIIPFSQRTSFITAGRTVEDFTIPGAGPYTVTLADPPRNVPTIPGFTYTDSAPGVGEFQVNFTTGELTFNSADANTAIEVTYTSLADIYTNLVGSTSFASSVPVSPAYTVTLPSLPINVPTIAGFTFTPATPAAGQFTVNFSTGVVTFNAADAGAPVTINYTPTIPAPPVVYNRFESGSAILIVLHNPGNFTLDMDAISFLVGQVVPAHVRFVLTVD